MTITVQVSDFRKNMAMFLGKLKMGHTIDIKKGSKYLARFSQHPKSLTKKSANGVADFLADVKLIKERIGIVRTRATTGEELNNEIDRILYGADRNGKVFSKSDR
ncbi:MAG: hypothetical protein WAV41_02000 [Microgenomates group bacterium]